MSCDDEKPVAMTLAYSIDIDHPGYGRVKCCHVNSKGDRRRMRLTLPLSEQLHMLRNESAWGTSYFADGGEFLAGDSGDESLISLLCKGKG